MVRCGGGQDSVNAERVLTILNALIRTRSCTSRPDDAMSGSDTTAAVLNARSSHWYDLHTHDVHPCISFSRFGNL